MVYFIVSETVVNRLSDLYLSITAIDEMDKITDRDH